MEINNKSPLVDPGVRVDRLGLQDQQAQRFNKADRNPAVEDPDRVEISIRSREIQHLDEMIRATPDVREALVLQIRKSIENGTYNVRAEQIAEKILGGNLIDEIC